MDFFEVIHKRHSVRNFNKKAIEKDKLGEMWLTIMRAPSAGNLKAYHYYEVRSDKQKKELARLALNQNFISSAPIVLVFCAFPPRSQIKYGEKGLFYSYCDAIIVASHAQLALTAMGLSSCWIGAFDIEGVAKLLKKKSNPEGYIPVCIMPIGYEKKTIS